MDNLQDLTGQESGVVIYGNGEAIICNWTGFRGLPRVFVTGLIGLGEDIPEVEPEIADSATIADHLHDARVIYDNNGDLSDLQAGKFSGRIYNLDNVVVIAPDEWA